MGYNTSYSITITPTKPEVNLVSTYSDIFRKLEEISGYDMDCSANDWAYITATWYDHEKDMATLSLCYPDYYFDVHGDGDNSDDIWESTWLNGMVHTRYMEIPPFDESKLQIHPDFDESYIPKATPPTDEINNLEEVI